MAEKPPALPSSALSNVSERHPRDRIRPSSPTLTPGVSPVWTAAARSSPVSPPPPSPSAAVSDVTSSDGLNCLLVETVYLAQIRVRGLPLIAR